MEGNSLRLVFNNVFVIYVWNVEKLVFFGSILVNELFNNSVVSKVFKVWYYSGLESLDFRVKVVVC